MAVAHSESSQAKSRRTSMPWFMSCSLAARQGCDEAQTVVRQRAGVARAASKRLGSSLTIQSEHAAAADLWRSPTLIQKKLTK